MIGSMLGQFRVLEKLGQGGMGEVYVAEDTALRRRVAIKRLPHGLLAEPHWSARLRREAVALAAVSHPNVVTIFAVAEADGVPFVVMELIEGSTLQQLLPPGGFELPRLLDLATGIVAGLEAAHAQGVVHRDLKPGNVMVTGSGRVKVLDFGLARLEPDAPAGSGQPLTATTPGLLLGTLAYMAPEQLSGASADRRSDFYSLGVMLFEMATGRLPFTAAAVPTLMRQILLDPPPRLTDIRPDAPERLSRLVSALLEKEPHRRPGSARLILDELGRCQRQTPDAAAPAPAQTATAAAPAADMVVAQLLIRGRHLWNKRTHESLMAALACFQQVIDRDPLQPKAWIGIAETLNLLSNYGLTAPGDGAIRVRAAVARAVELEGESGDALRALALAAWQFEFAWSEAETLYRRALATDPGSALTHHWYGVLLGVTRRFDEALAHFAQAETLDPLSLISLATRGWFTLFSGRAEEARAILRRVISLDVAYWPAYWFDGQALAALGRHEEAILSFGRAIELGGRTSRMLAYLGHASGLAGRRDEAKGLLDELRHREEEHYVPPYFKAIVLAGLDARPEALDLLAEALQTRDTMIRDLAIDTPWWALRDEPAYRALLDRMGLRPGASLRSP
jgi:tetratricopeptide (TPR) repeat protein/tRNA A-37 threonylcarbamoyl transferase component Bud32